MKNVKSDAVPNRTSVIGRRSRMIRRTSADPESLVNASDRPRLSVIAFVRYIKLRTAKGLSSPNLCRSISMRAVIHSRRASAGFPCNSGANREAEAMFSSTVATRILSTYPPMLAMRIVM
jgi:hypothetical protein